MMQIVESGPGQEPRNRQSADHAAPGQSLDQFGRQPGRAQGELIEEMRD